MKRDTRPQLRIALVVSLLLNQFAVAQESPGYSERMDVSLVNVDVIVTDRAGNRVRGLKAEDFTILEEGKAQPVANFAEYSSRAEAAGVTVEGAAPAASAERAPRQQRTFLVFVDEMALLAAKEDIRPSIARVLESALEPGDVGAVLSWTNRLNVRQGFTSDPAAMLAAIDSLPKPGPVFTTDGMFQTIRQDDLFWQSIAADPRNGGIAGGAEGPMGILIRESSATVAYADIKSKAKAVNAAMSAMAGAQGRKVLLLVTHRFSRIAGREYYLSPRSMVSRPSPGERRYDTADLIESVAATANAAGFTVYGLYPEGIRATFDSAETSVPPDPHAGPIGARDHMIVMNETESLDLITDRTGGEYAIGSDALKLLPRIGDDLTDYYSLAFRTEARGTDNRRRISVRVKNRNHRVRTRSEIAERSDSTRMKDLVSAAVFAAIDPGVIPVEATLGKPKDGRLPLTIRIPVSALTTTARSGVHEGAFTVYLAWNSSGTISEVTRNTQPFTIADADLARAKGSHFTYTYDVRVDKSTRALGVGVLDETSKEYGAVTVDLGRSAAGNRESASLR